MNYKLIKIGYLSIAFVTLSLCLLVYLVPDLFSINLLVIIFASLAVPFFVLKILHEQKYPPTRTQKIIGAVIGFVTIMATFFIW